MCATRYHRAWLAAWNTERLDAEAGEPRTPACRSALSRGSAGHACHPGNQPAIQLVDGRSATAQRSFCLIWRNGGESTWSPASTPPSSCKPLGCQSALIRQLGMPETPAAMKHTAATTIFGMASPEREVRVRNDDDDADASSAAEINYASLSSEMGGSHRLRHLTVAHSQAGVNSA